MNYENNTENSIRDEMLENMVDEWIKCNTVCDLGTTNKLQNIKGLAKADYYMKTLPAADFVKTQTLNYIFSNGLTTGSINEDEILDSFLYSVNEQGTTNYSVLWNAVGKAITHGSCGIRWLDGAIYQYNPETYKALKVRIDGVQQVIGFIASTKDERIDDVVHGLDLADSISEYSDVLRRLSERNLALFTKDEFLNLRNDTSLDYGYSPLLRDELRLDLLAAVYERLNYDIRYDGTGRIVIRPKDGYVSGEENDISSTTLLNQSTAATKKRVDAIKAEAERVANELKNSTSDSVIVLSNAFDKEITHLGRVTKATEFFNWIKDEGVMIAQDFGMSPSLLELGGISGNVSMTSIIDNAMLNSIVPLRERYAIQFSPFLCENLGLTKVFFNKYEMQQSENENTMRTQIVNIMSILNSIDTDKSKDLLSDFADMLWENIHNENNQLEEL